MYVDKKKRRWPRAALALLLLFAAAGLLRMAAPRSGQDMEEESIAALKAAVERIKAESAERMQALEKQLSKADPDTTTLMVLFKSWQETYTKMWETLNRIEAADSDKAQKLRGGIRKALETALEQMGGGAA